MSWIRRLTKGAVRPLAARPAPRRGWFGYLNFNQVDSAQISRFLKDNGLEIRQRANGQIVARTCPLCPKPHNNVTSNLWTLNFKEESGVFLCFRCGASGSWADFVKSVTVGAFDLGHDSPHEAKNKVPLDKVRSFHNEKLGNLVSAHENLVQEADIGGLDEKSLHHIKMLHDLTDPEKGRGISFEVLSKYEVGVGQEMFKNTAGEYELVNAVYFPSFGKHKHNLKESFVVTKTKIRGLAKRDKHYMRVHPAQALFGVFGMNVVAGVESPESVVITEGEFDAMAAFQATGIPAISLPYGASNLPPEMVAYLKEVKHIYLWMDFDEVGQLNVHTFAEKLGASRTSIVKEIPEETLEEILRKAAGASPSIEEAKVLEKQLVWLASHKIKDANDALRVSPELVREFVGRSKSLPQQNIIRFSQLREVVKERIFHQERFRGVSSLYFNWFNSLVKGFRRGE